LLLGAEIVVPGASLIWLGLAAFAAGAIGLLLGPAWQIQILLFALLSLAAVMAGRWLAARGGAGSDRPFLNRRIDALVGRTFILEGAIHDG
ncbi:NfeD family protein, partial [Klebsiella pneumoniae]|nr:NfeD family protein [Klebsiella pneumoniae]